MNEYLGTMPLSVVSKANYPGRGGGYSKKFYTGRLRPEVQPLTLLYTIFSEKVPLLYTFYWKKEPLSYTFLRRLMNKSLIPEWRFSNPFIYLNLWNPYPFIYLKPEKCTPFRRSLPVKAIIGSTPPPGPITNFVSYTYQLSVKISSFVRHLGFPSSQRHLISTPHWMES